MLTESTDPLVQYGIYKGIMGLSLQQAIDVMLEARSQGIYLDIREMFNKRLLKVSDMGFAPMMNQQGSALIVSEKKEDLELTRGKWTKNRNENYVKEKARKNTQNKIKKEGELRKSRGTYWMGGAPRPKLLLQTLGVTNLVQVGMFWPNRDDAELAITEQCELENRVVRFRRDGNRLRALCSTKNEACCFAINVRFGEQMVQGESSTMHGWHVTKTTKHTCNSFRDASATMYSNDLLARSLLSKTAGLKLPSVNECKLLLKDITLREVSYNKVWRVRKQLEDLILGRKDDRVHFLPAIVDRLKKDGHYCEYAAIDAEGMRKLKHDVLLHEHTLRYKKVKNKPIFDEKSIDYSTIRDDCRYLTWLFFASKTAMAQSVVINEPNGEADFTFGHSVHQGVIGLELTCDAERKIIPRAWMWSAADESTKVWSIFLKHITAAYPHLDTPENVLKLDGAKGAWAAVTSVMKRVGFRDHKHRSENAQNKFGLKGKLAYHRIAKSRDVESRDKLIEEQSVDFQTWLSLVGFEHWSAAEQHQVHGQYETTCVEGMNNLMKNWVDIRAADPVTALRRWINWEANYFEKRKNLATKAVGIVTPRLQKIIQDFRLTRSSYQITELSQDKRSSTVTFLQPQSKQLACPTFQTRILTQKDKETGMQVTCTCNRHLQGIICDHVAAHVDEVGIWRLENLVHRRDTMSFYKSQYPSQLSSFPVTCLTELTSDPTLCMPVVRMVRKGRPKKARHLSWREKMIKTGKKTVKRKCESIDESKKRGKLN